MGLRHRALRGAQFSFPHTHHSHSIWDTHREAKLTTQSLASSYSTSLLPTNKLCSLQFSLVSPHTLNRTCVSQQNHMTNSSHCLKHPHVPVRLEGREKAEESRSRVPFTLTPLLLLSFVSSSQLILALIFCPTESVCPVCLANCCTTLFFKSPTEP